MGKNIAFTSYSDKVTSEKWTTVVSGMATEGFFYVKTPNFSHEKDMFIV